MRMMLLLIATFIFQLSHAQDISLADPTFLSGSKTLTVDGTKYVLPKKLIIQKENTPLFQDTETRPWNVETDRIKYFQFEKKTFLIISEWDTADYTSFRLFHLGNTKEQTKEFTIMGAVEEENGAVFFTSKKKLYYWEKPFCESNKAYQFDDKKIEFVEVKFNKQKGKKCLPSELETAKVKNKITDIPVNIYQ